jgi:protein SCO1
VALLCVVLGALVAACGGSSGGGSDDGDTGSPGGDDGGVYEGLDLGEPLPKPDIVLTDTSGRPYDLRAESDGAVTLLYFMYTTCPDICPIHLAQLASVLEEPDAPGNVEVVAVTVDPERDTPGVLREYLDTFSTDFVGLTGSQAQLEQIQRAANVPLAVKIPDDELGYTMGHAGQVIAYAPDDMAYVVYPFGTRKSHYAHDLPLLAAIGTDGTAQGQAAPV